MLGLVISSISKFASEMSEENVVRKHADKIRARTLERTTSDPMEIERLEILQNFQGAHVKPISAPFHARKMDNRSRQAGSVASVRSSQRRSSVIPAIHKRMNFREAIKIRNKKTKLLRHERDRFNEMRRIQMSTLAFKRWWALTVSVAAFAILWLVGAVIFWQTERPGQGWTYFDGLYFCYISLLTIGYGDFTPTSNAGRSFFVVWSLIAVPTMTLLISDMGSTVIESFKRGTFIAADFTVMLKKNVLADFINAHPRIKLWLIRRRQANAYRKRMREGLPVGTEDADTGTVDGAEVDEAAGTGIIRARSRRDSHAMNEQRDVEAREAGIRPSLDKLAREVQHDRAHPPPLAHMMRRLATAIRSVAQDLKLGGAERQYSFEEWAELTRLIRFTGEDFDQAVEREDEDVIEWDWLGEDSPMMTHASEPEFVLDRLCESLVRYTRKVERRVLWVKRELNKSRAADERMDSRQVMEEPDEESERTVGQLEQKQLENGD
jgi:potassium channel subfamily K